MQLEARCGALVGLRADVAGSKVCLRKGLVKFCTNGRRHPPPPQRVSSIFTFDCILDPIIVKDIFNHEARYLAGPSGMLKPARRPSPCWTATYRFSGRLHCLSSPPFLP